MNQQDFLQRIRQAVHSGRAYRVHARDVPDSAGYVGVQGDPCAALAAEIEAVGGKAEVVAGRDEARAAMTRLLDHYSVRSALCWNHPVLQGLDLAGLLDSRQVDWHDYQRLAGLSQDEQRRTVLQADLGISSVDMAVGETGTLAVVSKPGQERQVSLVPPVHLAVVQQDQIVPDLFDIFQALSTVPFDELPSNLSLITGPSKTGDIELQLTTGVHGPGNWHVLIASGQLSAES